MRTNNSLTLTVVLLFFMQFAIGQNNDEKVIKAKIIVDSSSSVEGINVINSSNENTTSTDKNGEFSILTKAGDVLVLTAVQLEINKKIIDKNDLKSNLIIIKMIPKTTQLKEVIINEYSNITAEKLGIIPKGQKSYTPAERKLKTAGDFKPIDLLGLLGGQLAVDPILNAFSGRTAMLKKELIVEKKEQLLAKTDVLFEDKYYTETLKIPSEYIKGFQYYCIEDKDFAAKLKAKNKTLSMFFMVTLARNYKQTIENEK